MQPSCAIQWKFALALVTVAGLTAGLSTGCRESQSRSGTSNNASLVGAGYTFSSVLFKKWFETYHGLYPDVAVAYQSVGSGEGVRRFIGKGIKKDEQVDFGASDAAMQDAEIAQVEHGAVMLPITAGGVVLAYNLPGFDGELKLSREAYSGIFLGKITRWNDPLIVVTNPGVRLPPMEIVPVIRLDSSGTTFAFTNHLDAISNEWHKRYGVSKLIGSQGNAMRVAGNEGVAGRIQLTVGSVGYIEYQFSRQLNLKIATLENREGKFVRPTEQAFVAGLSAAQLPDNLRAFVPDPSGIDSYPIVTFSWVLLRKSDPDMKKAKTLRELFTWCLLDGQRYSSEMGYVPLPESVASKSLTALNGLGTIQ